MADLKMDVRILDLPDLKAEIERLREMTHEAAEKGVVMDEPTDRMLKWFAHEHLKPELAAVSAMFSALAHAVVNEVPSGPERTVALRKLLESKDAAVRAVIHPGG